MGLESNGYVRDSFEQLVIQAQESFIAEFEDVENNKTPSVIADSFLGIQSIEIAKVREEIQEDIESVYFSAFIATADGVSLDRAVEPTERQDETFAQTFETIIGVPGTEILGQTIIETAQKVQFATQGSITIPGGGEVEVLVQALVAGSSGNVPEDSITFLPEPVDGVTSVNNEFPTACGEPVEEDPELRERAISERSVGKTSALDAVVNRVRAVAGVSAAVGAENTGTAIDAEGRPPGSIAISVRGGLDLDIAQAILDSNSAGVFTFGDEIIQLPDESGEIRTIRFSRVTIRDIFVKYDLDVTAAYDDSQDDLVRQQCLNYIGGINPDFEESQGVDIGEDIFSYKCEGVLFNTVDPDQFIGIEKVTAFVSIIVSPVDQTKIEIPLNEEALTDFGKIVVNKSVV